MNNIIMNFCFACIVLSLCVACNTDMEATSADTSKPASTSVKVDDHGKTPNDYIVDYYQAVNADDYQALQDMCTKGYYNAIVTKNGFLKTPDPDLFPKVFERKMFKHTSFTITDRRSGFHTKVNAPNVYSVGCKVLFTETYKGEFEKLNGFRAEHINDEVCFKLEDGAWKLTDKIKGY